ncbi:MAG: PD-(D/E)XK nuclease family protein, partial [Pricia sp.]
MQSFLEEVVDKIKVKYEALDDLIFVLPSKRAGTFLKNALARDTNKTIFAPDIYSIETFIEKISGLSYATQTQQLFHLYQTYRDQTPQNPDNFYSFSKWGQTLLQDINEIDRYLVNAPKLFDNLSAIQELDHWSLQSEKTQMMKDHLTFWNNLAPLYKDFNTSLLEQNLGHQGLVYRKACENLESYLTTQPDKIFIFLGFNALNTAESQIIQHILEQRSSEIYWDIDAYFLQDDVHDASYFIRQHHKKWPYLVKNGLDGISENYLAEKNIKIIGVPKNVSQAKYTGQLLQNLLQEKPNQLKRTAVVLGDETLLNPILNAVPETVAAVNITMGYPLGKTALADFFDKFISLCQSRTVHGWYYAEVLGLLALPSAHTLINRESRTDVAQIIETIKRKNWTYIDTSKLSKIVGKEREAIALLFPVETPNPQQLIALALKIIGKLKNIRQNENNLLALEYLYRFYELFNQLDEMVKSHDFIKDLKSFQSLYRDLLSSETLDFQGEPLEGLQVMGMLESRNLDFETVIITSVNEGILPSGKSNNSFIPFDLKIFSGLPTYKEKDAVYTYHFYRLLQRAKNVYILYSTEPDDGLGGGERSRLINQLLTDENKISDITETYASACISPTLKSLEQIKKDAALLDRIAEHAANGFSPTSLSNYIRNPIDFYKRNLLGINDVMEVEETVAANTFGTIVHDTLEDLYRPFIGKILTEEHLSAANSKIDSLVNHHFSKSYGDGDISRGKNLIALHVARRYIENFIALEMEEVKN